MKILAMRIPGLKRSKRPPLGPSIYGPDPGDASVEHALGELLDEIRQGVKDARRCPAVTQAELDDRLARAIMPGARIPRALVRLALRLSRRSGSQP